MGSKVRAAARMCSTHVCMCGARGGAFVHRYQRAQPASRGGGGAWSPRGARDRTLSPGQGASGWSARRKVANEWPCAHSDAAASQMAKENHI